ncbi:AGAP012477-PA-like protein [Anopheles sinensis]|uniref:AGAP012477-PA-like protein n=1 Tax=Anopheles sinensis TaxID=74873 RepID=A0A084W4S2_ANOSI|nr:AGAP012477-PA-like protein [Anopheles sinensis]
MTERCRRSFGTSETAHNRLLRSKSDEAVRLGDPTSSSSSRPLISGASFDASSSRVVLNVVPSASPGLASERFEFPGVWLRDNCQCSECFHRGSSSRVLNWETFDVDRARVIDVRVQEGGHALEVLWEEGHRSVYELQWLLDRSFREGDTREYLREWYRPDPVLWGAERFEAGEVLQEFRFQEVLHDDEVLLRWIEALIRYGVVMIKGAPLTEHECRRLAERVGFIRKTHYGEEFIVKAKEGTSNVAYLSTPLQMHTDLPYYDYKPGCNLLHCLVQSTNTVGGENLIADGFYVAERMRHEHPDDFQLLAETLVNWSDLGEDEGGAFHSIYRAPMICIGRDGRLERINHSVPQRDSHFSVPLERVERWYRAMQRFVAILHREAVKFRTSPGDILTFSNVRMVHGRTGYTDTSGNTRHIVGAYLDWDEIYSRLRVLKAAEKKKH